MIIIGLGSNVGDRLEQLDKALSAISAIATIKHISSLYESPALLPENAPNEWDIPFLNMCVSIDTDYTPEQFIASIADIEADLGRDAAHERWSPRTIDIDILTWNDLVKDTEVLTLPHPDMHKRDFVLLPLLDIAPKWLYPTGEMKGMMPDNLLEAFCETREAKKFDAGDRLSQYG